MTMPAGKYYVGDLCYVMHDEWDECCELFFAGRSDHGCNTGEFNLKDGRRFAIYSTAFGDGYYPTNCGANLGVDAGSIGCVRVEDIDTKNPDNNTSLGHIYRFENDFEVETDGRVLTFGDVRIDTDPYADDYDED